MNRTAEPFSRPPAERTTRRALRWWATGPLALTLLFALAGADGGHAQTVPCAEPTEMPAVERVFGPVPVPGTWRGRGFGDKRKLDVEIAACGRIIEDMVGVRLAHVAPISVDLERDEEDGRYKASYTHAERGMAVVVTWNLEVESESRVAGRMTIMGRSDDVEFELLDAQPAVEMAACACAAVEQRRDRLAAALASSQGRGAPGAGDEEAARAELRSWAVDPSTCEIGALDPDQTLPTEASFDVVLQADWQGRLFEQRICCARRGDRAPFTEADRATVRPEALSAAISVLETWLEAACPEEASD